MLGPHKYANDVLRVGDFDQNNPYINNLNLLKGLPFYCWNTQILYANCCFNHLIGLPKDKNDVEHPLYDYEKTIIETLDKEKHLWILKATGLGITELMLRYMAWLCLKDDKLSGSQMCIVTGPRIDLAITLIDRMKKLFYENEELNVRFNTRETIIELNGVLIQAYPSNHLDSMRGIKNVSLILLDEADFFSVGEQQDARDVSERYIGKSNPFIIMVSTPNKPEELFDNISKEPEETCIYKRLKLDYTYGLNKIYTNEDIEKARQSPSWNREYNLKFEGGIGNLFNPSQVDNCIKLGEEFSIDKIPLNPMNVHSVGVDPGFGSSRFGIVVTEHLIEQSKIRVIYAEEFEQSNPRDMVNLLFDFHRKHWNTWYYIDGANAGFIRQLKVAFDESPDFDYNKVSPQAMQVVPVHFSVEHKDMLSNLYTAVNKEYLTVPEKYDKLIISLRTAYSNEYSLDKERTSYNDLLDGLRLSLKMYKL